MYLIMSRIEKKDWVSSFNLIGAAKVNDYTFKIDQRKENSLWQYNQLSLAVDCGEKHGVVYAEMMGGYDTENNSVIYAHGKNEDGNDNFDDKIMVAWEDRFNDSILQDIGDLSFITVGLEKTTNEKVFYKKFLSAYDAIAYIHEHLEDGMVVNVKGNLKYSKYNDNVQVRKNITSIVLSKVNEPSKYIAKFMQSILLDKDSIGVIDKARGVIPINARVLDYVKEMGGTEIKGQYPFNKTFEYEVDLSDERLVQKIKDKLFKVRNDVTQINFEGNFIESGATVTATEDDIPDDIKELIEINVYTLEEALAKCSENGNKEQRMILKKPVIRMIGNENEKRPVVQKFEKRYKESDLIVSLDVKKSKTEDVPEESSSVSDDDTDSMDWLNSL